MDPISPRNISNAKSKSQSSSQPSETTEENYVFKKPAIPPVPLPRKKIKEDNKISPKILSERASTSQDISEITSNKNQSEPSSPLRENSLDDIKSYRSLIKERFQTIKNQAAKSAIQSNGFRTASRNISNLKQTIDIIKRDNTRIEENVKCYIQRQDSDKNGFVSRTGIYNFFVEDNGLEV